MLMIDLVYKKPLSEVEKYVDKHRSFLRKYYEKNFLVVSGPKIPKTGGFILANTTNKDLVKKFIQEDPFYQKGIADYTVTAFEPVLSSQDFLKIKEKPFQESNLEL